MRILAIETSCDETAIAIAEFSGSKKRPAISVLSNIVSSQIALHKKFGGVVPNLARREHERNLPIILLKALKESTLLSISKKIPKSKIKTINPPAFPRGIGSRGKDVKTPFIPAVHPPTKFWLGDKRPQGIRKGGGIKNILARELGLFARIVEYAVLARPPAIDAIAVTYGPGLAPALWVGVNFARALSVLWNKPLIPVNHMAGHFYSALLQKESRNPEHEIRPSSPEPQAKGSPKQITNRKSQIPNRLEFRISNLELPAIALLVSGGHTELVLVKKLWTFRVIGETRDDAAGEAFDKVARILGLQYPGGPALSALAEKCSISNFPAKHEARLGRRFSIKLPRPMIQSEDYDFSFSGLKTAVLYLTRDLGAKQTKKFRPFIAREFQNAVVDVLVKKTVRAAKAYEAKTILLGGGVAANALLREQLAKEIARLVPPPKLLIPDVSLTGDNALMIAVAAYFAGKKKAPDKVGADANLRLSP